MIRIVALVALVLGFVPTAHAGSVIHVADGDCATLFNAASTAPAGEQTTIVLAQRGTFRAHDDVQCGVWVHGGNVVVEGGGSLLSSDICGGGPVIVDAGATLTLRNTILRGTPCGIGGTTFPDITNHGELQLESVTLGVAMTTNDSGASMTLRNVTMGPSDTSIKNDGSLYVFNSSLISGFVGGSSTSSLLVVANSIAVSAYHPDLCQLSSAGRLESLGGNVVGTACAWTTATDRRSTFGAAALGPLQDNGGLGMPTFAPTSSSVVRGVGLAKYCESTDARQLVRPAGACDAGAVQFDATKYVAEGGMNGLWYDRAANGHYVTIQRVHDDDTALVIWNTFDRNGNQSWIYGVGHVTGKHIHVEMSQNLGGRLQPGGAPTGSSVTSWGTVDVDLASCVSGTLRYASPNAAYGSGQFPIDRLAYVSDFGCVD